MRKLAEAHTFRFGSALTNPALDPLLRRHRCDLQNVPESIRLRAAHELHGGSDAALQLGDPENVLGSVRPHVAQYVRVPAARMQRSKRGPGRCGSQRTVAGAEWWYHSLWCENPHAPHSTGVREAERSLNEAFHDHCQGNTALSQLGASLDGSTEGPSTTGFQARDHYKGGVRPRIPDTPSGDR